MEIMSTLAEALPNIIRQKILIENLSNFAITKDPRDAVILKKGSTVDGLRNLHKGAVVSKSWDH